MSVDELAQVLMRRYVSVSESRRMLGMSEKLGIAARDRAEGIAARNIVEMISRMPVTGHNPPEWRR